jgi:hypothetical protein
MFWTFEHLNFGFVSNFDIRISDFKWLIHSPQMDHVKLPKLDKKLLKQDTSLKNMVKSIKITNRHPI